MHKPNAFTLTDIKTALQKLDIPFAITYTRLAIANDTQYSFKSLKEVGTHGIYFLASGIKNIPLIENAIIFAAPDNHYQGKNNIILSVENPQLVFYQLMEMLVGELKRPTGIHASAIISEDCIIDPNAYIGPYCVLEGCTVMGGVKLHSHVTVMPGTIIEENVTIESHSTIGVTGVAWIWDPLTRRRVVQPQIGKTTIKQDTFIGSNVTIGRGSVNETTIIGKGCMITHGSKISHGSIIDAGCHLSTHVSITGNVNLGTECFIGAGAVINPHVKLAARTVIGAGSVVLTSTHQPGMVLVGSPAKPVKPISNNMSGVPKPLT